MFSLSAQEVDAAEPLGETYACHRCGQAHEVIDSTPPGMLQAVRCGDATVLVGIRWKMIPPPKAPPKSERVTAQPPPEESQGPAIWELVLDDMAMRSTEGERKYGKPLRAHNGRDALIDAYQEALDLCVYLRQALYERDGR